MSTELGGFAEFSEDIDGDFEAFNYCIALDYVGALYDEDFESVGEINGDFFDKICLWINYDGRNEKTAQELKTGSYITGEGRTLIDAIYDKKAVTLADVYVNEERVYSPKLILTLLLSDGISKVFITPFDDSKRDGIFKALFDLIEKEFLQQKDKHEFVIKIKNNLKKLSSDTKYKRGFSIEGYEWIKSLNMYQSK